MIINRKTNLIVIKIIFFKNKALKKRHWERISEILDYNIDIEAEDLKLRRIMEAPLMKFKEEIEVCLHIIIEFL